MANGQGNYFDGMQLHSQAADGLDKDWGDVQETSFAKVLGYITTGAYPSQSINSITQQQQPAVKQGNLILDAPSFKGAIDTRRMK